MALSLNLRRSIIVLLTFKLIALGLIWWGWFSPNDQLEVSPLSMTQHMFTKTDAVEY